MLFLQFNFCVRSHSLRWERTAEFGSPLKEMSVEPQLNLTAQVNCTRSLTADTQGFPPDCTWTALEHFLHGSWGTVICLHARGLNVVVVGVIDDDFLSSPVALISSYVGAS